MPDASEQTTLIRIDHATKKLDALTTGEDDVVSSMECKRKFLAKKGFHEFTILFCLLPIIGEDDKVIAVAQIQLHAQCVFHVPVEFVEIDIRKYLARDIADGNAPRRFDSTLSLSLSLQIANFLCSK